MERFLGELNPFSFRVVEAKKNDTDKGYGKGERKDRPLSPNHGAKNGSGAARPGQQR
jgi:hypothetical protein